MLTEQEILNHCGYIMNMAQKYAESRKISPTGQRINDLFQSAVLAVLQEKDKYDSSRGAISTWISCVAYRAIDNEAIKMKQSLSYSPDTYHKKVKLNPEMLRKNLDISKVTVISKENAYNNIEEYLPDLDEQERSIINLLRQGESYKDIQVRLNIKRAKFDRRLKILFEKIRLANDDQL